MQINFTRFIHFFLHTPGEIKYCINRMPEGCVDCEDYGVCSGEQCKVHTLYYGVVRDMQEEVTLWGDMVIKAEKETFDALPEAEKQKRKNANTKESAKNERKIKEAFKENTITSNRIANCVTVGGKLMLKHKFKLECKNEDMPDETLSDGSKFPGGCWANEKGYCPFMHKDEKGKYDFKGAKRIVLVNAGPSKNSGRPPTGTRRRSKSPPKWRGGKRTMRKY